MARFFSKVILVLLLLEGSALLGSETIWHPGLVDNMAGRFGAFMEGYRYRKLGYLTLISDGTDVYSITMGDNLFLGRPYLPTSYTYEEKYNWTGAERTWSFQSQEGGQAYLKVYESLLAPGFLYETSDRIFRWSFEEQKTGQGFILPLESGVVCRGEGERYLASVNGPLTEDWMLVTFSGSMYPFDCPLLFIFENKPSQIEVVTHEFVDMRFEGPAGKIGVMPLYGVKKIDRKESALWRDKVPPEVVSSCSEWARLIMHYPVGAAEAYSFDEQGGLTVKNDYKYVSFKNALGAPVAPIPPFVRMARLSGYPVEINGLIVETRYPTHYGMLDYVTGEELTYKIPACSYVDKTLAPVRVEELKEALPVEKALMAILLEPRWIWPGDHDYLPDDVMDTMHNLRLLAWATWSLSEKSRKRCIRELARPGLEKINENNYIFFKDPVASATYARDSTIFAQRGKTSYDSDWYNGFQLAGLWAYRYFGDRDAGLELTRSHWPLWTALRNYMEIYHDWATCSSTTDPRGNLTDYDCMRNGWAGLLAFARLARDTGKQDLYFQTKYLASKTMVALYVQWTLQEYFYDLAASFAPDSGKGLLRYKRDEITGIDRIDAYSSHSFTLPDNQAPYNLSACIPEHSLFLSDYGLLDRVRKLTYDLMPRHFPDWSKFDPAGIKGSGDWTSANAAAGRYFYFLDPHLFVRAINFNEPLAQLLSYRPLDWLSGQIIEAMLVGSRPMLIMPTNAEFFGNTWNNRERSLTFTLEGNGLADLEIWNCIRPQKISPDAVMRYDAQKRTAYLQIELKGREKTKVFF